MWLRKVLIVAAVAAPLVWTPVDAAAQARGQDRAAPATQASSQASETPAGLLHAFAGRLAPDALVHRFPGLQPQPEPEPEVDPTPEPEPEEETTEPCSTEMVWIDGQPYAEDCNGNLTPINF
jgi:hypothetical protein